MIRSRRKKKLHRATQFMTGSRFTKCYTKQDKNLLDRYLRDLIAIRWYQKQDCIYMPCFSKLQADAVLGFRGFAFTLIPVNNPSWDYRKGIESFTSGSSYWNTLCNPSLLTGLINWQLSSAGVSRWTNTEAEPAASGARTSFAVTNSGTVRFVFADRNAAGNFAGRIHNTSTNITVANTTSLGWQALTRTGSTASAIYNELTEVTSTSAVTSALPASSILVGARSVDGAPDQFADRRYAVVFIGGGFTAAENSAAYLFTQRFVRSLNAL